MLSNVALDHPVTLFEPNGTRLDNICLWHFACGIVWDRNDSTVGYSMMGEKMRLELGWSNLQSL
jgi:hypothetical protein